MQTYGEANNGKFPDPYAKIIFEEKTVFEEEKKKDKKKKKKKLSSRSKKKRDRDIDANGNRVRPIITFKTHHARCREEKSFFVSTLFVSLTFLSSPFTVLLCYWLAGGI